MYDCQTKKKFDTTLLAGKEATFEGALIFIDNYIRDKYRDVPISGVIIHCHFCVPYILSFKRELDEHRRRREAEAYEKWQKIKELESNRLRREEAEAYVHRYGLK